jgi:hypothetical protein
MTLYAVYFDVLDLNNYIINEFSPWFEFVMIKNI